MGLASLLLIGFYAAMNSLNGIEPTNQHITIYSSHSSVEISNSSIDSLIKLELYGAIITCIHL